MFKRIVSSATALTLGLSLILTGCGASKEGADQSSAAKGSTAPSVASETKEEAEPVTLKFLGFKSGKELGALPEINKSFQDANPGVTIEYDAIPTTTNYMDVLKARLATGDGPDVYMSHIGEIYVLSESGHALDLSNEPWVPTLLDTYVKSQEHQGKIFTLPIESSGLGLVANMSVLEKNGVALPTNWGELEATCEKLKANGITPFIFGNKSGWSGAVMINNGYKSEHKDFDDPITTDLVTGKIKASEVWGPYLKKYETIVNKGWSNADASLGMEFNDAAVAEFAKGNSAFLIGGTWMISQIRDALKGQNTVFAAIPMQDDGPAVAELLAGTCLAINPQNKNVELAKKLLAFWADDNNMKKWVLSQSAFTTLKGGTSMSDPEAKPFADTIAAGNATLGPKSDDAWKNVDLWTPMTKETQLLSIKKTTAEKVGKSFDDIVKKTLELQK